MFRAVDFEKVFGFGRRKSLGGPLEVDHLIGLTHKGEPVTTTQDPTWRHCREHLAVTLDLDQVDPLQASEPGIGDRDPVERSPGVDLHLGRELVQVLGELLKRVLAVGKDLRNHEDEHDDPGDRRDQTDLGYLEETDRVLAALLQESGRGQVGRGADHGQDSAEDCRVGDREQELRG